LGFPRKDGDTKSQQEEHAEGIAKYTQETFS
jgi:hypothetical protein